MTRYLGHLTGVLLASIPVVAAITALLGRDVGESQWSLPLWFALVLLISVPVHFIVDRASTRTLLRRLRTDAPDAPAIPVRVDRRDAVRLLAADAPARLGSVGERVRFGNLSVRAMDQLIILVRTDTLELWTGPAWSPVQVASFPWREVQLSEGSSRILVMQNAQVIARLSPIDEHSFTQRVAIGDRLRSILAALSSKGID